MTKKELIFTAGAKLFAERSYDAVGIRDIANESGVNSAMLSYYYAGKSGLLREIFIQFTVLLLESKKETLAKSTDMDSLSVHTTRIFLTAARANRNIYIVGLRELNSNREEIRDLSEALQERVWNQFSIFLEKIGITNVKDEHESDMIFTTIMGTIFSDYLLGGGTYIDDDANFEKYIRIVTTILQRGASQLWQ